SRSHLADLIGSSASLRQAPHVTRLFGVAPIVEHDDKGSIPEFFSPTTIYLDHSIRTRHLLCCGPTGEGKTTKLILSIIRSDIADLDTSIIILDSKSGELLPFIYELAEQYGRSPDSVMVLDLVNPDRSIGWNPLEDLRTEHDIYDFAERLCW